MKTPAQYLTEGKLAKEAGLANTSPYKAGTEADRFWVTGWENNGLHAPTVGGFKIPRPLGF